MPKINLYRNISITFIVFTAILLVAVFLFFSNSATILITPDFQKIDLSFNLEIKENPSTDELRNDNVVTGKLVTYSKSGSGVFNALSTKTVDSEIIGVVKLINNSNRDQRLVKTTQLQASNGVIVRTNEGVVVPGGGSVTVEVFAKDPSTFSDIIPGKLVIIKLNPSLQDSIYAVSEKVLNNQPREVGIISSSDITRANDQLSNQLLEDVKTEANLSDNDSFVVSVRDYSFDGEIGDEMDTFTLKNTIDVKVLEIDNQQLASLIAKKVGDLDLAGLEVGQIDINDVAYTIIEDDLDGSVLVKVNYSIIAGIGESNELLDPSNFAGKQSEDVINTLLSHASIRDVKVLISPYWRHNLPNQGSKIDINIEY